MPVGTTAVLLAVGAIPVGVAASEAQAAKPAVRIKHRNMKLREILSIILLIARIGRPHSQL